MENEQIKQKFPVGMIIILIFIGWGIVALLFEMSKNPLSNIYQLGPVLASGVGAIIVNLVIVGILGTIFYGIIKRLKWVRKLTIRWYIFSMALMLINLISFLANKTMYGSYYQKTLSPEAYSLYLNNPAIMTGAIILTLISTSVIWLIIIVYFSRKKDFFVN